MHKAEIIRTYMSRLEQNVIVPGIRLGLYDQKLRAAIKTQRLHETPFGQLVGIEFDCNMYCVIDYYGLIKKSSPLMQRIRHLQLQGFSIRSVEVPVAYFSAVKDEHIKDLAPEMLEDFAKFKQILVDLRDFPTTKKK